MITVHLRCGRGAALYEREYPDFPIDIAGIRFTTGGQEGDWLAQTSDHMEPVETRLPRERRVLVMSEPGGYFPADFVNQFGILISPFGIAGYDGVWRQGHGGLPSFFGIEFVDRQFRVAMDYKQLAALPVPEKRDTISVVLSRKSQLPGHRQRLRFLRYLSGILGPRLEAYGTGSREIADKANAILPCRYHLVLENTVMPSYWTEKLADSWLGYAFPVVSGPPDLARWFPPESFRSVDIDDPVRSAKTILRTLDEEPSPERFAAILEARRRVLTEERICPVIARVVAAHPNNARRLGQPETLWPPRKRPALARLGRKIGRAWWKLETRLRS